MTARPAARDRRIDRHAVALALAGLTAAAIAVFTLAPVGPPGDAGRDKVYHFVAFAALLLPMAALYARSLVWMIPAALAFGGGIELVQPYFGRGTELADFFADVLGAAAGTGVGLVLRATLTRPLKDP